MSTSTNNQSKRLKQITWPFIAIIFIAIVVAVTVAVLSARHPDKQAAQNNSQGSAYRYNDLIDSKVIGSATSLEFQRPKEFTARSRESTLLRGEYVHIGYGANKQTAVLGDITAFAPHYIIADNPPVDLSAVAQSFNSGSGYQTYLGTLHINDFILGELANRYYPNLKMAQVKMSIDKPSILTNTNIKKNAWLFSFKAQGPDQTDAVVQGDLVFAIGKSTSVYNGYNYLMIATPDYNWQANMQVWNRVINSFNYTDKQ